jgi:hypothetical protein
VYVDADEVNYTHGTQWLSARGTVVIRVAGDQQVMLRANRVEGNLETGELAASEEVRVEHEEAIFEAQGAIYNLETGDFVLDQANGSTRLDRARSLVRIHAKGRHARREGEVIYIISGRLTTCDDERPHYAIHGDYIEVAPGKHVIIKGAQLQLFGLRLPKAPTIRLPLGKGPRRSPFPRFGYSSRNGPFLADNRALGGRGTHFRTELAYYVTARRGVLGTVSSDYYGNGWGATLRAGYEEYLRDDVTDTLYLDTLPEFTLRAEGPLDTVEGLSYFGSGSTGYFRENPTSADAARHRFEAGLRYGELDRQAGEGLWAGLALRQSFYNTGDDFRDIEASFGAGRRWSHRWRGAFTLIGHATDGRTPFEFDDVDIPWELQGSARVGLTRNWYLGGIGRYDLERASLRDYTLTLTRRVHCLSFSLHYRHVGQDFGASIDVNGITNDLPATD